MKNIRNRIGFCIYYFLFWIVYFVFARLFFLLYYFEKTQELSFATILKTFTYGLQLDISFAAYLSIIPFLVVLISVILKSTLLQKLLFIYTSTASIIISLLLLIDAGLYASWGVRLDSSLVPYLNTPKLMLSSVSTFQLVIGIIAWCFISIVTIKLFSRIIYSKYKNLETKNWIEIPIILLLIVSLIIPIRGGFQTIPVNQSNVYFSNNMFANHAAINFIWNFSNSLTHKYDASNPYKIYENEVSKNIILKNRNILLKSEKENILSLDKPNIILLIWESLPAKIVGSLGGETNVTENLNKLSKEGVLFTNFYANGDRTDKAIPSILSSYYPPPVMRIMRMPNKTRSLPMLPKEMAKLGYKTSFYYGGDLNFGNMNTYLRNAGINDIIGGDVFDKADWNSKWGAFDDVFLERLAKDLSKKQDEPFFKIALTSTSHEPYEIKGPYKFGKDSEENLFKSAHVFTDKAIGNFIRFAKNQDWYKNTLIVIMADHGHTLPKHPGPFNAPARFRIPMLWLGGAVENKGIKIDNYASQVDFPYTILDILKGDNSSFVNGKNIFSSNENQYVHYIFNKGFGTLDKNGVFVFDYVSKQSILKSGTSSKKLDTLGKALLQDAFQDFIDR